jgi:hypothetical protein
MISQPKSVPELLREEIPDVPLAEATDSFAAVWRSQSGRQHRASVARFRFCRSWGMEPASTIASSG